MGSTGSDPGFIVWGIDQTPYGPVELPTLIAWLKDERVTSDTWVFTTQNCSWQKAAQMAELQMFFRSSRPGTVGSVASGQAIKPGTLRRVKILAAMSEEQLERLAPFLEVSRVPQWSVVVKQGDYGDAMYLILEGELRVRLEVEGKEKILATLGAGEFFGDISLLDHGPRSADVVANADSVVAKLGAATVTSLAREAPDLATQLLLSIGRTLTARIRADNKRFGDFVKFAASST